MFQLKSDLKCRKCNHKKIKFETNYMFDLPLSLCKMVTVEINLYRLPFRYKLYFDKINKKFDEFIEKEGVEVETEVEVEVEVEIEAEVEINIGRIMKKK